MSGIGGHPGEFPAEIVGVVDGFVIFKSAPEAVEYLAKQIMKVGIVKWIPNHPDYQPDSGAAPESPVQP